MVQVSDREYALRLLQDLRVKARDAENYAELRRLEQLIKKFEKGIKEEFGDPVNKS